MDPYTPKGTSLRLRSSLRSVTVVSRYSLPLMMRTDQGRLDGYSQQLADLWPKVIRLDEHRVLKNGPCNRLEPDTMQFLAANTTIPIPKIYDIKLDVENDESYIVMEHMPGERLERVWVNLTEDQRVSICCQIAECLAQLKQLTSKKIESVNGGPVRFGVYDCYWGGPFDTEKEFNDFVV